MDLQLVSGYMPADKEFKGRRVVSFRDIDLAHQKPAGTAGQNFQENREQFIEGKDYLRIRAVELHHNKTVGSALKVSKDIILITKSGYLMIAKSFHDDLSRQVQSMLVRCYFRTKSGNQVKK